MVAVLLSSCRQSILHPYTQFVVTCRKRYHVSNCYRHLTASIQRLTSIQRTNPIIMTKDCVVVCCNYAIGNTHPVKSHGTKVLQLYCDATRIRRHGYRVIGVYQFADTCIENQRLVGILVENKSRAQARGLVRLIELAGRKSIEIIAGRDTV